MDGYESWEWFITRTLRDDLAHDPGFTKPGLATARRCLAELLTVAQATAFVCVFEAQKERGVPHLHVLLTSQSCMNRRWMQLHDDERWGFSRWIRYEPRKGGGSYLGKYLSKEMTELYIWSGTHKCAKPSCLEGCWTIKDVMRTRV